MSLSPKEKKEAIEVAARALRDMVNAHTRAVRSSRERRNEWTFRAMDAALNAAAETFAGQPQVLPEQQKAMRALREEYTRLCNPLVELYPDWKQLFS